VIAVERDDVRATLTDLQEAATNGRWSV